MYPHSHTVRDFPIRHTLAMHILTKCQLKNTCARPVCLPEQINATKVGPNQAVTDGKA